ncbi:polyphosphate--glucose phosphotransferase [Arcanobacterium pinnipediorum]|uniref:ROK family protein n=1 Tax=Arcanobacterium pinnipediorum TaxID=1503041 RepID=A0ABY5AJQ5_9ACTO|nr:ROK family protein [Arcanobacterium pinnipediorum]USR80085.1 ROK family protein [Arcanobacterium pinnipediorum]
MTTPLSAQAIGVDIGGSGIKGAIVNTATGEFIGEEKRIPTPELAKPEVIADIVSQIVDSFDMEPNIPVGVTFPAPIINGVCPLVANLSQDFVGMNVAELMSAHVGRPVVVLNDADAAGLAEAEFGAAHGQDGTTIVLTLGTGIGSALVRDGMLVPNTEMGHILLPNGLKAEKWAASSIRTKENLSLEQWAQRLQDVIDMVEMLFSPDTLILGGGISTRFDEFSGFLSTRADLEPARLFNTAGIAGAALVAAQEQA